jgi:glycosyltransferase involved in cell wall biosynthesis
VKLVITQANLILKGGAEAVVLEIAKHYNAKIYTAEYDRHGTFDEYRNIDIEVIGKGGSSGSSRMKQGISYASAFYNFKVKEDYDVLNAHIAPSHWASNRNERVLWYCHTPLREIYDLYSYRMELRKHYQRPVYAAGARILRSIDRRMVKKIDRIVANSMNTASRVEKYYGRNANAVIGGGVDYKGYRNDGFGRYFFYPSRISPNKRQDYAIRAFEIFRKKHKGYRLIIAGQVSKEEGHQRYYKKIVDEAKRVGGVEILSNVGSQKMLELYAEARCILYTPINEDYGLVPLEGMASGKPVIAVNEGGPKETVVEGKTGYLVNSEAEMADRMSRIADDERLAETLGKQGRKRVVSEYSWSRFFERFDIELSKVR